MLIPSPLPVSFSLDVISLKRASIFSTVGGLEKDPVQEKVFGWHGLFFFSFQSFTFVFLFFIWEKTRQVITVNGARVVRPDIQASNGVIHIVDRVIFPVPQADIYNTLKNDPQQRYTTLVSAIDRAGLTSVLANPTGNFRSSITSTSWSVHEFQFGKNWRKFFPLFTAGPYTVFAPTNKAFSLISRAELNSILEDPAKLTKLLQRHVVQDLIYTSGLQGFQKAYALDFEILYIYHAKGELTEDVPFTFWFLNEFLVFFPRPYRYD